MSWAATSTDGAVVVTTFGLYLPGQPRLGWHQIHKATWGGSRLTVIPATESASVGAASVGAESVGAETVGDYTVMVDGPAIDLILPDPGDVPFDIRERVTKSVAHTSHHEVPGGGVRIVARRIPGRNGVAWHVRYDDGTSPSAEATEATTALVAGVAAALHDPSLR